MRISGATSVPAANINNNVLSGSAFEFIKRPSRVRFYLVGDVNGDFRVTVQAGAEVLMEESPVSRAARYPLVPDDLTVEDIAMPGDRLKVQARNTDAVNAETLFWAVDIQEIA